MTAREELRVQAQATTTRKLREAFVALPHRLYADDPAWVAPLDSDVRDQMNPAKNPFHKHALIEHFVVLDAGGAPVGRVAACVYPRPGDDGWAGEGAFGFFECVDDQAVADALLGAAEAWLRAQGCSKVVGPYSYCATQDSGLLTGGFGVAPTVFQTHNPPYYEHLLRQAGYDTKYRAAAYDFSVDDFLSRRPGLDATTGRETLTLEGLRRRGQSVLKSRGLTVRRLDRRRYAQDMEIVRRLLNITFAQNEGVLPVTADVFAYQVGQLKPFIDPRLVAFVERDGEPVAFSLLAPDAFQVLKPMNGKLSLKALLTLNSRIKALDKAVILLVGTLPERSLIGVGWILLAELVESLGRGGYRTVATTWVHESNAIVHRWAAELGGQATKTYAIFSRELAAA